MVPLKQSLHGKDPVYIFGDDGVEMQATGATTLAETRRKAIQI